MPIQLIVIEGPETGRTFAFAGHENFVVGRSEEAHFQLSKEDRHCSRLHFMIEMNPPLCQVLDLESNNGTHVNGDRITGRTRLNDGDRIKAGRTLLQVRIIPEDSETTLDDEPSTINVLPPLARAVPVVQVTPVVPIVPVAKPVPATPAASQKGQLPILAGYRMESELGRGGLGVVYRALRLADNVTVAIKYIQPARQDQNARKKFLRAVKGVSKLEHPRVARTFLMGSQADMLVIISEFIEGGVPITSLLRVHGPLPVAFAVGLTSQILEGLEYGHRQDWVHRDLKPTNILVSKNAAGRQSVKLTDFGLARVYQASPLSGLSLGEEEGAPLMLHAAPEVLSNASAALKASDQYSAAVVLYELLTGKLPYPPAKSQAQVYANILLKPPIPARQIRADLPAGLETALSMALEKKAERRFPSLEAFWKALQPFMA